MYMVNELDFRVVPLASDELTRRAVRSLEKTIEVSNDASERHHFVMVDLTLILFAVGLLQIFVTIFSSDKPGWLQIVLMIGTGVFLVYMIIDVFKHKGKTKTK